jgi:nicotinamide-nucleotide amidase
MVSRRFTAEVLNVGNELLDGRTVNTNLSWICGRLTQLGYVVRRATVVRDEKSEIARAVKEVLRRRPRWLFISGGLGPTHDDKTLEAVSAALGKRLVLYPEVVRRLEKRYMQLFEKGIIKDPALTPERLKMAKLPRGAKPLENVEGAAPGVLLERSGVRIVCLPGVPKELMSIFERELAPVLAKEAGGRGYVVRSLTVKDVVESVLAPVLVDTMTRYPSVYLKSNPKGVEDGSVVVVDFIAEKSREDELRQAMEYFGKKVEQMRGG